MSIVLQGSTSGSCTLQEQAIAGTTVLTLPTTSGTILTTGSSGQSIPRAALPAGSVLQVIQTSKIDIFSTTSTSYTDVTGLSVNITPTSSSNRILVFASVSFGTSGDDGLVRLVRDSTAIGSGTGGSVDNGFAMVSASYSNQPFSTVINFLDSPATTSAVTYKIQAIMRSGTGYVNRRGSNASFGTSSQITVMEIAA